MLESVLPVLSSLVFCDRNLLWISRFPRVHISVHLALPNFILYYVVCFIVLLLSVSVTLQKLSSVCSCLSLSSRYFATQILQNCTYLANTDLRLCHHRTWQFFFCEAFASKSNRHVELISSFRRPIRFVLYVR